MPKGRDKPGPRVSVIVPVRDAAATLGRTLACLANQSTAEPYEVIVVDDGSSDGSDRIAEQAGPAVTLIRQPGMGASAARNRGAEEATGEILAFTDADCFPEPGWLDAGVRELGGADLVVGRIEPDTPARAGPFDRSLEVTREAGLYESANMFIRRELFERVGRFEEWLKDRGRPLGEDAWLGWRARRAGARTSFAACAVVRHAVLPQSACDYVRERRRLRHFPHIATRIPELRDQLFVGRYFVGRRTAVFDAALAGVLLAAVSRSRVPLIAALPYARQLARESLHWRARAPEVAASRVAADLVGLASLLEASVRHRTLVL